MPQPKRIPHDRRIAELEAQVLELQSRLVASVATERSLAEDGLRLSLENEALRKELAALKKSRK